MLFMRKAYFDAIRRGEKTATLRYWRWPRVRPDTVHTIRGLGRVHVDDVTIVRPAELTEAHARAEGFESLAALGEALETIYPPAKRQGRDLYLVRFTFMDAPPRPGEAAITPPTPGS